MKNIDIITEGFIHHQDSAFPTLVTLDNGDLICGFNVGGGPEATGGSEWARSTDNGISWQCEGVILSRQENPVRANAMRLSKLNDGRVIAYGQRNYLEGEKVVFGALQNDSVFCVADAECRSWSKPTIIPLQAKVPVEVSNPIVVLHDGRLLAPAGLLPAKERLGEKVVVRESSDNGESWPNEYTVFVDQDGKKGFFEFKIIETTPGKLIAFAWTVELGSYKDFNNHYVVSNDGGKGWSIPKETSINGQTLTPYWLGGDEYLLIYNYRQSPQGIRIAGAKITNNECCVMWDEYIWQPTSSKFSNAHKSVDNGIDNFDNFKFGLPSISRLRDGSFIAVFWCCESRNYGIKSIKFNKQG